MLVDLYFQSTYDTYITKTLRMPKHATNDINYYNVDIIIIKDIDILITSTRFWGLFG